jgi:DNA repair protein RecN (Recombination protein N)
LVDAYGGLTSEAAEVRAAFARLRSLKAEIARERARVEKARTEADYLRHAFAELTSLAVEPGEELALAERRSIMMQAEKVAGELHDVQATVNGEHSPMPALSAALRRLERRQIQAPSLIAPVTEALDAALNAFDLAGQALDRALRDADFDPRQLERIEERLFALRAAGRKYGVPIDALPSLAEKFAADRLPWHRSAGSVNIASKKPSTLPPGMIFWKSSKNATDAAPR